MLNKHATHLSFKTSSLSPVLKVSLGGHRPGRPPGLLLAVLIGYRQTWPPHGGAQLARGSHQRGAASSPGERPLLAVSSWRAPLGSCIERGICLETWGSEFSLFLGFRLCIGTPHQ